MGSTSKSVCGLQGTTPLHEALFQGDESMIHQLIMHGADLHVRDNLVGSVQQ